MSNDIIIRDATKSDIKGIVNLYGKHKSIEEIQWLLFHEKGPETVSQVAISKDIIVGHCGGIVSTHYLNDNPIKVIVPILWIVHPDFQNTIGLKLFLSVLSSFDNYMVIGGSKTTKKIIPLLRFKQIIGALTWVKLILPISFRSIDKSPFKISSASNEKLDQYQSHFYQNIDRSYLNWMSECPLIDTEYFEIKYEDKVVARCFLSFKFRLGFIKTAQISLLQIQSLDIDDQKKLIRFLLCYLRKKKSILVTIFSTMKERNSLMKSSGFFAPKRLVKPIFFEGEDIPEENNSSIDLSFLEGDLSYRNL